MDPTLYEARVEEALTIKQRSRRDQVRLMLMFKEADQDGCLIKFCEDTGYTEAGAGNYLIAYSKFVELGALPQFLPTADIDVPDSVPFLWGETFDATADGRFGYGSVDRDAIEEEARAAGLRGTTKALDIAKNPRSLGVAILADPRAAQAALDAIVTLAERDPLIARSIRTRVARPDLPVPGRFPQPSPAEVLREILYSLDHSSERLVTFDVPEGMEDFVVTHVEEVQGTLTEVKTIMEGRQTLRAL